MNKFPLFFVSLFLLILTACGSPKLNPLSSSGIILAFGDSLTAGVGVSEGQSYPSVLARLSGKTVINAGVSGETTAQGLKRLPEWLEKHTPELLILLEGGNDILQNRDSMLIKQDLQQMIEIARHYGVQVVLLGVPEKRLFSDSAPLYGELAKAHDLAFDGETIARLIRSPSKKSDSVHFNAAGYAALAERIYALLSKEGALP